MALKVLKPRLRPMAQRLRSMSALRDTAGTSDAVIRSWYKSKRWQELRQAVLSRDLFICQRTGVPLMGRAPAPDSPVVHHKTPHKGDEMLFWDMSNLISVSKAWHDTEGQREDRQQWRD